jgi:hypothetical protein
MFTSDIIKARLNQRPFVPVRIIASEGLTFDIYHPDLVWVGWNELHVGFASPDHPTTYDRTIRLAMSHVVGLEDLPAPAPANKNGQTT